MVEEIEVRFSDGGRARSPPLAAASLRLRPRRLLLCDRGEHTSLPDIFPSPLSSSFDGAIVPVRRRRGTSSPAWNTATIRRAVLSTE